MRSFFFLSLMLLSIVGVAKEKPVARHDYGFRDNVLRELAEVRSDQRRLFKQNKRLQRSVAQLTQRMEHMIELMERGYTSGPVAQVPLYSCSLNTQIGTFLGSGNTRVAASARALQQCDARFDKGSYGGYASRYCKSNRVKCSSAQGHD